MPIPVQLFTDFHKTELRLGLVLIFFYVKSKSYNPCRSTARIPILYLKIWIIIKNPLKNRYLAF